MRLHENAVLSNMLTTRFRNWRPVILITLYSLLLLGTIIVTMGFSSVVSGDTNLSGTSMYNTLVIFQFFLIVFIMPAMTAGLISGERERKTLDLLLCTQMTPLSIVLGKLLSGCMFMALCVVCSIPMITLAYLYGGISILSILSIVACYLVTIVAIGSLGVFFSTIFKRTTAAVVVTYLAVFILGIVSTVGGYLQMALDAYMHNMQGNYVPAYPVFWIINPAMALFEIIGAGNGMSILGTLMSLAGQGQWPVMWGWELLTLVLFSALLIFLSSRILAPRKGWRTWKNGNGTGKTVR